MLETALIYEVIDENFFAVCEGRKKEFYYLQKNISKKFYKYLEPGVKIAFEHSNKKTFHYGYNAYVVKDVFTISKRNIRGKEVFFYDVDIIRNGIKQLLSRMDNIMFVDFEMNMQDYKPIPNFVQEIIETGMLLTNKTGAIRQFKHWHINPTKAPYLTKRTIKFLHYDEHTMDEAVSFTDFYEELVKINRRYNPYVVVWGKSDIDTLKKCCEINGLSPLPLHFVNLLQLLVNYYNLKESPGLFKTWEKLFEQTLPEQAHDSFEDATITKDVFFKFKEIILQ